MNPTQNITLHSKDLMINKVDVVVKDISSENGKELPISNIHYVKENDYLIIALNEQLIKDHKHQLSIIFTGKLDDGLAGFYRSSYHGKHHKKVWLGVTQFEAISARRAFPCFDEPDMKATFDISIGRQEQYKAISNMPLLQTEPM